MGRKSSVLKMFSEIPDNREIRAFPAPFRINCTPYEKRDFTEKVKNLSNDEITTISTCLSICKVIVLGDVGVGKTCIVERFCRQIYDSKYKATIGVDFEVERFSVLQVPFTLQIWDTAGQERFRSIAQSYYRHADVIIIVFDLTNGLSLLNSKNWLKEALDASGTREPLIFLVGSKLDLISTATYELMETSAMKLARKLQAEYWAVSSKTGENIQHLFNRLAALAFVEYISKTDFQTHKAPEISSDLVSFKKNSKKQHEHHAKCGSKCT